jgi:uncharacterized integral membrane protein (TIGR00698 family)
MSIEVAPRPGKMVVVPGALLALVLAIASYYLATLPGLKVMGPLTVALIVGITWRATAGVNDVIVPGAKFTARTILRLGVLLMGARLDFGLVAKAGPKILFLDVAIIVLGIITIAWIARRFGVEAKLAMLMAVGTSICGASAVAAAAPVLKAHEDDVTLAVALCGILGTVGVLFYVVVGPFIGLTTMQLAIMSGASLHEVAQVMAAAFTWGQQTGDMGTLVKLTRVLLLAPALVVLGLMTGGGGLKYSFKEPPIPYFVLGFLVLGAAGSVGLVPPALKNELATTSIFLMVMAMAAMGLNTHLAMIKKAGMRVIYAGLLGFALLAGVSYVIIRVLGIQ